MSNGSFPLHARQSILSLIFFRYFLFLDTKSRKNLNKIREEIMDGWLHVTSRTKQEATRMSQSYNNYRTLAHVTI